MRSSGERVVDVAVTLFAAAAFSAAICSGVLKASASRVPQAVLLSVKAAYTLRPAKKY
jgi:hypothetical protein